MAALAESRMLASADLPALHRAADDQSQSGQRRYLRGTRVRLGFVVLAAVAGVLASKDERWKVVAWAGAACFLAAAFVELHLRTSRPERLWYDGRAVAESAKSLAWRYSVGGDPFPAALGKAADAAFVEQLRSVMEVVPGAAIVPTDPTGAEITAGMRELRDDILDNRRALYLENRVGDQKRWYGTRARVNETSVQRWTAFLVAAEFIGVLSCVLQAAGVVRVDAAGVASAIVAAGVAWIQTRQHANLASAYAVAHHELGLVEARASGARSEEEWAQFVGESEEAISREHALWRASRRC